MGKRDWSLDDYTGAAELRAAVRAVCIKHVRSRFDIVWSDALEQALIRHISDRDRAPGAVLRDLGTAAARIRDLARQGRWPFDVQGIALYSGDPLFDPSHARFMVFGPPLDEELIPVVPCAPDGTPVGTGSGLLVAGGSGVQPCADDGTPIGQRHFAKASDFGTSRPTATPTVARQRLVNDVRRGVLCGRGPLLCLEASRESRPAKVVDGRAQCFYCPYTYDAKLEACPECGAPRGEEQACCGGRCARLAKDCEIAHVYLLLQDAAYFEKKVSDAGGSSHVQYVLDSECDSIKSARLDLKRPKAPRKRRRSA